MANHSNLPVLFRTLYIYYTMNKQSIIVIINEMVYSQKLTNNILRNALAFPLQTSNACSNWLIIDRNPAAFQSVSG